jgi:purine-binding chemotaxis protein CheW
LAFGQAAGGEKAGSGEWVLTGDTMASQDPVDDRLELSGDEDFYEKDREQKEPGIQVISFRLGREWFAVEIERVMEVIRGGRVTEVPSNPDYIVGIHNLRGNVISVTDPKKLFGLEGAPALENGRIIVVSADETETGFIVDEVSRVMNVDQAKLDPPLSTLPTDKSQYVKGRRTAYHASRYRNDYSEDESAE